MANPRAANRATNAQVFEFLSSWSTHAESWASAPRKILIRYEDLLADPEKHFARIIDYLGGAPEPERLRRAITFSDFHTLSAQETQHDYTAGGPSGPFFPYRKIRRMARHANAGTGSADRERSSPHHAKVRIPGLRKEVVLF